MGGWVRQSRVMGSAQKQRKREAPITSNTGRGTVPSVGQPIEDRCGKVLWGRLVVGARGLLFSVKVPEKKQVALGGSDVSRPFGLPLWFDNAC